MKQTTKFLLVTATFFMIGIIMSFSTPRVLEDMPRTKPEKVVVNVDSTTSIDTAVTVDIDSLPLREQVYDYIVSEKGLTRNHAIGLIANGDRESLWRLSILGDRGTSGGIFQWHGTRFKKLKANCPDWKTNWKAQVDYALAEHRGPEFVAKEFSTPQAAADWWMRYWEIPANKGAAQVKNNSFIKSYCF